MIDDAAWVTYPLHLAVGIVKTFLFILLLMGAVMLYTGEWMFTAHDDRAELIKDFATEQTVYRVDFGTGATSVAKQGYPVEKDVFAANFDWCAGTDSQLHNNTWWDRRWLADKSDMFQGAYIVASHNMAALNYALSEIEIGREVSSFRNACIYQSPYIKIPNAPVVNVAFLQHTDDEVQNPAGAQYNYFTGMCLASANCATADYSPRNDSIYADALYHQVTPNQAAALKALADTGSPGFWIAAAHANGIYGKDALIAVYAKLNKQQLENDLLRHIPTPEEDFLHQAEIAIGCSLAFIGSIALWIACRASRFARLREN